MAAYVIVDIQVHDAERYEEYKKLATVSITAHGGRYLVRGGKVEVLEGEWSTNRLVILEFPSLDRAREWWSSAGYSEGKRIRHQTATSRMILVEGL